MAQMGRPGLSAAQKHDLWNRWRLGQSLSEIGRALSKHAGSIHGVISDNGGIVPKDRKRSCIHLQLQEREEISRGLANRLSIRQIAHRLNRSPSTIYREITRNGGIEKYRANQADCAAWNSARRPQRCLLAKNPKLNLLVADKLRLDWSPEQIAGWLKMEYANNAPFQVSHETIYRSLFVQARGVLKKELVGHLRTRKMMRQSKRGKSQPRGQIVDGISIHERPAEIEDRAVPGHWEGDLITGSHNTHIATLVERTSRFTMLVQVDGKDTHSVVAALTREVKKLPTQLRKSLTWDRGMELASHKQFTVATNVKVYYCDPQSPWQRGSNENTNRLLRQYFPKGTDLSQFNQKQLNAVALKLNTRPRKTLGFITPCCKLQESVALTG